MFCFLEIIRNRVFGSYSDIDECKVSNSCHSNAICADTLGAFTCICHTGFTGDGFNCTDIDECTEKTHECHPNGTCQNTEGSYTCECGDWYKPVPDTGNRNCTPCMTISYFITLSFHVMNIFLKVLLLRILQLISRIQKA